jgi:hypothetical protein
MSRYRVEIRLKDAPPDAEPLMVIGVSTKAEAEWLAAALSDEDSTVIITRDAPAPDTPVN